MTTAELLKAIDRLKATMVGVATGGPRIEDVQEIYSETFDMVSIELARRGLDNNLPFRDLWEWYGHWRGSPELKTYQSRRTFVATTFAPLVRSIQSEQTTGDTMARQPSQTTQRPDLNPQQLRGVIERLQKRITEVEALESFSLDKWSPKVDALQAAIDENLSRAFGYKTVEYNRYRRTVNWAAEIPSAGGETSLQQFQEDVAKGKAEVLTMLNQAIKSLREELAERDMSSMPIITSPGSNIIIGHGRSLLWRELKDFVKDRLRLPVEEFNSVPVAGVTTVERLSQMLDGSAFAFLLMTAEDEQPDGKIRARENVVHEVGLFQGRLGFKRAIILLEEGCAEFSNITGLGQIRFPKGNISAIFEEIRRVLEREGVKAS